MVLQFSFIVNNSEIIHLIANNRLDSLMPFFLELPCDELKQSIMVKVCFTVPVFSFLRR